MKPALSVINRQKTRSVSAPLLRKITLCVLEELRAEESCEIAIYLIETDEMTRLNGEFLRHEGSTDVITFDYSERGGPWRGDIFISMPDAVAQGAAFDCSWQEELARYVAHGLLHLAGCDDTRPELRRVMKQRENKLLKELSARFDLGKLERPKNA